MLLSKAQRLDSIYVTRYFQFDINTGSIHQTFARWGTTEAQTLQQNVQ